MKKVINFVENVFITASITSGAVFCFAWCFLVHPLALYCLVSMICCMVMAVFCEIAKQ